MNYLIAVFPDRITVELAYTALEKEGLPLSQISILGKGFKTADEFGFIDPTVSAKKQATLMSYWLVPFGFIAGVTFSVATQYNLFPWAGMIGNHIFGGIFGAIAGAMGSFFVGGGVGLSSGGGDALPYRNRLKQGKYILAVQGAPNLTNQATRILKTLNPESIQGYVDPTRKTS
jgi:hypothetical protein